jgi:hypothetical protein
MKLAGEPYEFYILRQDGTRAKESRQGYVYMDDGEKYKIGIKTPVCGVARVYIDGKHIGSPITPMLHPLETPPNEPGRRFTFFAVGSDGAVVGGQETISKEDRGLVSVTFVPEVTMAATMDWDEGVATQSFGDRPQLFSCSGLKERAGITALTGASSQTFRKVSMDVDETRAVTLTLRLISRPKAEEVTPLTGRKATPVPPPVE